MSKWKGEVALVGTAIIYGLYGVYSRMIGLDFGIFSQGWIRNLTVALIVLVILALRHDLKFSFRKWKWVAAWLIAGYGSLIFVFIAFNKIPIGTTYFVNHAGMLLASYAVGIYLFKESFSRKKLFSLLLIFSGLYVICSFRFDFSYLKYIFFSIFSGICAGLWDSISKKISDDYSTFQMICIDGLGGFLFYGIMAIMFKEHVPAISLSVPWAGLALTVMSQFVAVGLLVYGFKHTPVHIGALIMPLEVFFGALFGFIFYHEILSVSILIGGLLIFTGLIVPHLKLNLVSSFAENTDHR